MSHVQKVSQCKVCNSKHRVVIEQMHINGFSAEKIYEYLQNLSEPGEKAVVTAEDIKPSSIRRHIQRHFNNEEGAKVKIAEAKAKIDQSRNLYQQGVQIVVDKVNTISHMIDVAMIKFEELDHDQSTSGKKHQLTIQYMNSIKGLIETLGKLTGDLKQEGTIDINYFGNQISDFADIVMLSIREVDKAMGLNGELELNFAKEFMNQWQNFQDRQQRMMAGELNTDSRIITINTFNETQ